MLTENSSKNELTISIFNKIDKIGANKWNALANPHGTSFDPFLSYEFLSALEDSGCVGANTGWQPVYLSAQQNNQLVGLLPLYLKHHSYGEYIFDHLFADAYERAGGQYYPKLLGAIPFTPVTGRRILVRDEDDREGIETLLLKAARELGAQNQLSSLHLNFIDTNLYGLLAERDDFALRISQQFHFFNRGYRDFADFLSGLNSAKRKNLRKERLQAQKSVKIEQLQGDKLTETYWDQFFRFYMDTASRKWGQPYLNREFFSLLHDRLRQHCLLILAKKKDETIAASLHLIGDNALYGRYWGCSEYIPNLHFELCYYQAIDYALAHGLTRVEAGAQGGHKLLRGYEPVPIYSAHQFFDPAFARIAGQYLEQERRDMQTELTRLSAFAPFKHQ